jgi:hypothetical protein
LTETGARLQSNEESRAAADRGWIAALLAVLFTIHVSRMGLDKSALGVLSPLVAMIGDVFVALGLAYFVIVPLRLLGRRLTRRLERRAWERMLDAPPRTGLTAWAEHALRAWLESRMRFAIRLRSARYSLRSAFGRGLQIGLPMAAVVVASVPIWGMSWYFRHGELGSRDLELLGRGAHGRLARRDGASGGGRRPNDARRTGLHRESRGPYRPQAVLLHRHRRHG